jgi:hypothetical protein
MSALPHAASQSEVATALRADALIEVVLGVLLVTGLATGLLDSLDLPAADAVVVAFGALLLPFAAVLWVWAARESPRDGPLGLLAAVNALTGAALAAWILVRAGDAGDAGIVFVLAVAAVLLGLAVAQLRVRRAS